MSRVVIPPKQQGETIILPPNGFNFLSQLGVTETISTAVVTASVYSGTDANPSAIISGVASISGAVVSQKFTAGVLGVVYAILCTITTSLGQTLEQSGYLTIVPDLP